MKHELKYKYTYKIKFAMVKMHLMHILFRTVWNKNFYHHSNSTLLYDMLCRGKRMRGATSPLLPPYIFTVWF